MIDFLINKFVDLNDRKKAGSISSYIGIACNVFLCALKIVLGLISNSISVISDGINNLTDCFSAIVTLVAFKLSANPADRKHPFGHGRYEYIAGLFTAIIIIMVGFGFLQTSFERILNPTDVHASIIVIIILFISILIKLLMYLFNNRLGTLLKSNTIQAMAKDSLSDCFVTIITIISLITTKYSNLPIDGIIGLIVSIIIIKTGIEIIIEAVNTLLGKPADEETINKIKEIVLAHNEILGMHDLIIHDYGPGKMFGTLHLEVDASRNVMESHEIIDYIENELYDKLNIIATIHMDPVDLNDEKTNNYRDLLTKIVNEIDPDLSIHDLRVISGVNHDNIVFDVMLDEKYYRKKQELNNLINDKLHKIKPSADAVITFDFKY